MRVAHICEDWLTGGIESLVLDLCAAMRSRGMESVILFLYGEDSVRNMSLSGPALPIGMRKKLRIDPIGLLRLRRALSRWRPDCLHCHGYYAALAALILRSTSLRVPILYTIHTDIHRGLQRSDFLIQWVAQSCDRVVAVSHYTASAVQAFTGGLVRPQVILNGVGLNRLELNGGFRRESKRRALDIHEKSLLLITVAALNRPKDHPTLFHAFSQFLRSFDDALLLVAGEGSDRTELERLVRRLGIHDRVTFLGRRTDVPELLAASDIFVLSTGTEGLPISVIEACCMGMPVVATDVGGLADLRRLGLRVLLTKSGDVGSLRDALLSLLDRQRRQLLGRELQQQARALFDIGRTAEQYRAAYEQLEAGIRGCREAA